MKGSPGAVLATATAAQAAISLVNFGLPAIGPELRSEFGLGLAALGAVETAALLGSGLFLIAAGIAVDRYGGRPVTLCGTVLATGALLAAAFMHETAALVALLFLAGVGTSIIPIAGIGALFRAYPVARRAWALGVRQMSVPLGGVIAAVLLPPLAHAGGARVVLLLIAGVNGVAGIVFALVGAGGRLEGPRPPVALLRLLRLPGMGRLLLTTALLIVVLQSTLVYAVPSVRDFGLSRFAAGAVFFAIQITAGVARIVWGRVADREGGGRRVRTLVEAAALASAGAVLFTGALHLGAAAVIPAAVVFAFGALGWNALVYTRAGEMAPPELAAQSVSVAATVIFTLSAVATPPMGALAAGAGWSAFWLVLAGLAAAAALLAGTLRVPRPARAV